jgi:hypothetical protein
MPLSKNLIVTCLFATSLTFLGCSKPETTDKTDPTESPATPAKVAATKPFAEVAKIPGTIEAENFDQGEPNVAYADVDEENLGAKDHRDPTQVDIEKRDDATGGYGVGWTRKGEWLVYTVSVEKAGSYKIEIPVASEKEGGTFHLEFDGQDVTGPIQVPNTGSWGTLQTVTVDGVQLKQGPQTMKLLLDTEGPTGSIGDIDHLKFSLEEY